MRGGILPFDMSPHMDSKGHYFEADHHHRCSYSSRLGLCQRGSLFRHGCQSAVSSATDLSPVNERNQGESRSIVMA
jgi:hypothetical protein